MLRAFVARFVAGGILLLVSTALLGAQALERVLYVSVVDKASRAPVTGLGPEDFIVREDNVRREVLRVTPATTPMPVAILVDNSAAATPTISDLRRGLTAFIQGLDGIGPIALIGVAERPTILVDYTSDAKALQAGVDRLFAVPGSGATLLDAITETARGLQKRDEDRAAVVLVTTENIEFSTLHYIQVLDRVRESGVTLHAVVFVNPGGSLNSDAARNRASVLDQGTRESGGARLDVLTSMAYEAQLKALAGIMTAEHRVVYARPTSLIPPEKVRVEAAKPEWWSRWPPW
ncbi:MAG: VWA domain-containing protein [Acidobacteria bacterium]|nr:VWA domain-containing protein [Acidobacteriota bacterium]